MALINCKECGKELSDTAEFCPHCGFKYNHEKEETVVNDEKQEQKIDEQPSQGEVQQQVQTSEQNMQQQAPDGFKSNNKQFDPKSFVKNKPATASIGVVVIAVVVGIIIATSIFNKVQEAKRPIKVDISMTEWYGYIDYILEELDLDFDLVTAGANCYTGVKKSEFNTEKYGILYTEFSYCKPNNRQVFRVYNDEKDQPLREPKSGELATFDRYGKKTSSGRNSL